MLREPVALNQRTLIAIGAMVAVVALLLWAFLAREWASGGGASSAPAWTPPTSAPASSTPDPYGGVNPYSFAAVAVGMTEGEVAAKLGRRGACTVGDASKACSWGDATVYFARQGAGGSWRVYAKDKP